MLAPSLPRSRSPFPGISWEASRGSESIATQPRGTGPSVRNYPTIVRTPCRGVALRPTVPSYTFIEKEPVLGDFRKTDRKSVV